MPERRSYAARMAASTNGLKEDDERRRLAAEKGSRALLAAVLKLVDNRAAA